MNKATRAARERKAAWVQAGLDGRIVRTNDGQTMTAYPTVAARDAALTTLAANGLKAEVVDPSLYVE